MKILYNRIRISRTPRITSVAERPELLAFSSEENTMETKMRERGMSAGLQFGCVVD